MTVNVSGGVQPAPLQRRHVRALELANQPPLRVPQSRPRRHVHARVHVREPPPVWANAHLVLRVLGREQHRLGSVKARAVQVSVVGVPARLPASSREEHRALRLVDVNDLPHHPLAARDPVLQLPGLAVVQVQVAPAVPLREPHHLAGRQHPHVRPPEDVQVGVHRPVRALLQQDPRRTARCVHLHEPERLEVPRLVQEVHAPAVVRPPDPVVLERRESRAGQGRVVYVHARPVPGVENHQLRRRRLLVARQRVPVRVQLRTAVVVAERRLHEMKLAHAPLVQLVRHKHRRIWRPRRHRRKRCSRQPVRHRLRIRLRSRRVVVVRPAVERQPYDFAPVRRPHEQVVPAHAQGPRFVRRSQLALRRRIHLFQRIRPQVAPPAPSGGLECHRCAVLRQVHRVLGDVSDGSLTARAASKCLRQSGVVERRRPLARLPVHQRELRPLARIPPVQQRPPAKHPPRSHAHVQRQPLHVPRQQPLSPPVGLRAKASLGSGYSHLPAWLQTHLPGEGDNNTHHQLHEIGIASEDAGRGLCRNSVDRAQSRLSRIRLRRRFRWGTRRLTGRIRPPRRPGSRACSGFYGRPWSGLACSRTFTCHCQDSDEEMATFNPDQ